jgi:hypothetical protein
MAAAPHVSTEIAPTAGGDVLAAIGRRGFAFVDGATMRGLLARAGALTDWQAFADSWDDLELDRYMADGGRYRRRRHAIYEATAGGAIRRRMHGPHYQSLDYNPLNGGIARWFEPVTAVGDGPSMHAILAFCRATFDRLAADVRAWHIETHQFRIEARHGEAGQPTPEGLHRDGVDYVLVLLIRRRNIAQGTTAIHALDRALLGSFTLTDPLDAAIVNDASVFHGVTAVEPVDPTAPAFRDVLVVTFRKV